MSIENCKECGGTHIGDNVCPLSPDYVPSKPWPKSASPSEPRRDEREASALECFISRWMDSEDFLSVTEMTVLIRLLLKERAARASAAPLKQTQILDNLARTEVAQGTYDLVPDDFAGRGEAAEQEQNKAGSVKANASVTDFKLPPLQSRTASNNSAASLPQPSAGHFNKTCSECGAWPGDRHEANCSTVAPSAGQTEGK